MVVVPEGAVRREGGGGKVLVADFGSLQISSDIQHYVPDVLVRMLLVIRAIIGIISLFSRRPL